MLKLDLEKLKNTKNILVLDFDLTITDIHTNGRINQQYFYWYKTQNLILLINCLKKLKKKNWLIYIVSRGIKNDIKQYLKNLDIIKLFNDIYGADNIEHLSENPLNWAKYKTDFLNEIISMNKINKNNLYFIDDTEENISFAKNSGFINSILLPNVGISSIILLGILEKILL